jgi:hypothetical protein
MTPELQAKLEAVRRNPPPPPPLADTVVLVHVTDENPVRVEGSVVWGDTLETGRLVALRSANTGAQPVRVTVSSPDGAVPPVVLDVAPRGVAGTRLGWESGRDLPVTRGPAETLVGVRCDVTVLDEPEPTRATAESPSPCPS